MSHCETKDISENTNEQPGHLNLQTSLLLRKAERVTLKIPELV